MTMSMSKGKGTTNLLGLFATVVAQSHQHVGRPCLVTE
jgi:hypothetical protein